MYVRVRRDTENSIYSNRYYNRDFFAENASFRSYGRRHLLAPNATNRSSPTKYGYQRNPRRQRLLRAHILNINMRTYITSAQGHEKDA